MFCRYNPGLVPGLFYGDSLQQVPRALMHADHVQAFGNALQFYGALHILRAEHGAPLHVEHERGATSIVQCGQMAVAGRGDERVGPRRRTRGRTR